MQDNEFLQPEIGPSGATSDDVSLDNTASEDLEVLRLAYRSRSSEDEIDAGEEGVSEED